MKTWSEEDEETLVEILEGLESLYHRCEDIDCVNMSPGIIFGGLVHGLIAKMEGDNSVDRLIDALKLLRSQQLGKGSDR